VVLGVSRRDGMPVVEGVEEGDVLLEVDGRPMTSATMGRAVDALRGRPGDLRTLAVERNGARITVPAAVKRPP
jgi:C-terminal processing protease CtpA/Prc